MNEIQIFSSAEFGEIRTIEENGKIWFCGKDVAGALGYIRAKDATNVIHFRGRHLPSYNPQQATESGKI